ncbi:hypothetical protein ABT324_31545 [Saccharopolyspora sp. NPDC000359]|uniref:hypothetical protein n=1 Tax=Saccharopolyspora sp. NPDC000359 TaxID=3154251 RepID=UPI00332ABB7A
MSWNDFHQRQHAIATVLDTARQDPSGALHQVPAPFTDATELLRALQCKWTQQLTGRVDVALVETEDAADGDRIQAVTEAWRRTAAANPELRALLDQHQADPELRAAAAREHRMLALASGLAEPGEPDAEVVRVGQAFLQLVRATPTQSRKARLLSLR